MKFIRTNQNGKQLEIVDNIYSMSRTRNVDGTDTMDVECGTHFDKGDRIIFMDSTHHPQEYLLSDMQESRENGLPVGSYHFTNSWQELASTFIEDKRVRGGSPLVALTRALEGTRWSVGRVESGSVPTADISFYHVSAAEAIQDICSTYGLELTTSFGLDASGTMIAARQINLLKQRGNPIPKRFQYGHNLQSVTRTIDPTNVITRLYPYGASIQETDETGQPTGGYSRKINISSVNDGKTYIEDVEATKRWGIPDAEGVIQPLSGTKDYDDIEDPQLLKDAAEADLPGMVNPVITYSGDVQLMQVGLVDVGDMVMIVDNTFDPPVYAQGRVSQVDDNPLTPGKGINVTLGTLQSPFTTSGDEIMAAVDGLLANKDLWDSAANLTPSYITSLIAQLNGQLNETGGYTYLTPNEGIIIYDRPVNDNPTMAIQLGGGFLRIANSKKGDGSWDWRTFGTGDGFTADLLNVGTIKGGANTWNLETGDILFEQGSIRNVDDSLVIDMNTGNVILTKGTIGNPDGNNWNLTTGDLTIRDGSIVISGYVSGHYTETRIDSTGFTVSGGDTSAGTGVSDGEVTLRGTTLGPDDDNYLKVDSSTKVMTVYSGGQEVFSLNGNRTNGTFSITAPGYNSPVLQATRDGSISDFDATSVNSPDGTSDVSVANQRILLRSTNGSYIALGASYSALGPGAAVVAGRYALYLESGAGHIYSDLSAKTGPRLDMNANFIALANDNASVSVNSDSVDIVPATASASTQALMDSKLISLADSGFDLDSPEASETVPVKMTEISIGDIHDVLTQLCNGDVTGARKTLDEAEAKQRAYTIHDWDMLRHGLDLTMEER